MKLSKFIVSILSLLLLTANSYAEQTGYEVELIIYEDATRRYIDSEDWSYNDMLNQTNVAVINEESIEPDAQFSELDWDGAVLSSALKKIQDSPGFNVLLTKRWRQTGLDRDEAYPVEIISDTAEASVQPVPEADSKVKSALNTEQIIAVPTTTNDDIQIIPTSIKGHVRLIMSRYLHFEVNLEYFKPQLDEYGSYVYKSYPVVSQRRMRSKEVHYIDHPMVGIIILATPYKIKSE